VVIGGGNAGLAAALTAGRLADRVLLLDRGPAALRGGNTRHTRNIRCAHSWSDVSSPGSYLFAELWHDLCGVGTGPGSEKLAELTVRESENVPAWMTGQGVRWQPPLAGTLHLGRTNRFFLGGGKALVNTYHRALAQLGVTVRYGVTVSDLVLDGDLCTGVRTADGVVAARAVVCASGGFEANVDWLRRYWGDAADNYLIRGSADNDGRVLAALYAHGAARAGEERGFHAVAIDARSPRFDGGIATRLDSIPFGIVVNRDGQRFYDEGEELWPKRYAIWGRNVAGQPGQIAYSLWDEKVRGLFLPPMYPPVSAGSVHDLAAALGLNPDAVAATVRSFNASIRPGGRFDPGGLDSCATEGLSPAKSHWAQPLDTPPFYAVPLRPGITFTYLGVAVTEQARVLRTDGSVLRNVFAAGEIMSGNILSTGYLAGFGLAIGHVWGRIAGAEAARGAAEAARHAG
jgi:tricarballylate dehydrogenase